MFEKQELLREVFELAVENEMNYFGCSQAVLGALQEKFGEITVDVFKAGSALAGGVARQGETCGALIAAIMAVGSVVGREKFEDMERFQEAMEPAIKAYSIFRQEVGHTSCSEIQRRLVGKAYRLYISEEREAFINARGHDRKGCPSVCGIAARAATEVILETKGL